MGDWGGGDFAATAADRVAMGLAGDLFAALIPIRLIVRGPLLAAHPWLQDAADLLSTVLLANLMLTVRYSSEQGWALLRPKFHHTLSDFSFSLYSIHMPLLILFRATTDSVMVQNGRSKTRRRRIGFCWPW